MIHRAPKRASRWTAGTSSATLSIAPPPARSPCNARTIPSSPSPCPNSPRPTAARRSWPPALAARLLAKPEDDFTANEPAATRFVGQVPRLQMQIDRYNSLINIYQRLVNDPNVPEERRKMFKSTISTYQQQIRVLREEKKRLVGIEP